MTQVELPADYYHVNFCALVDFVASRYRALLSADELAFYSAFKSLDSQAQKLYIRLLTRKGDYFRAVKLSYPELKPLSVQAQALVAAGLLSIDPAMELSVLMTLLTKAELIQRSGQTELKKLKRGELERALLELDGDEALALPSTLREGESIYQVLQGECFETFKLCFFGNLNQDMTDYVLRDLGLMVYENYPLESYLLPFQSRAQLDKHLQYYVCQNQLEESLQADAASMLALEKKLPAKDAADATLTRRVERFQLNIARQLERINALDEALQLYRSCPRPPSRERQARILVKQNKIEAALTLCRKIQADDGQNLMTGTHTSEEEQVFAADFAWRTARKHLPAEQLREWSAPDKYSPQTDTVDLIQGVDSVELLAVEHLAAEGDCFYVENSLLIGVFGLYFWDIVFAPVAGAFFNPFQLAPADFYSPDFIVQRESLIRGRLETLDRETLSERTWQQWEAKQGRANPLVNWSNLSPSLLKLALQRIPLAHWQAIFIRLLRDIRNHRSGFPDLIHFPFSGGYELVEIKGPGDKLQKNQLRWMAYFSAHNIPHRALHIRYIDADVT